MRAELPYLVSLEHVVLAHPIQLASGVISHPLDLRKENTLITSTIRKQTSPSEIQLGTIDSLVVRFKDRIILLFPFYNTFA